MSWAMVVGTYLLVFFTMVIAVASWRSASASRKAAIATAEGIRAQILAALLNEFWSDDFLDSARILREWQVRHAGRFVGEFSKHFADGKALQNQPQAIRELDKARRRVKGYFAKIQQYSKQNLLTDEDIKGHLVNEYQVGLLLEVVEPLEESRGSTVGASLYSNFARLYPAVDRPRPMEAGESARRITEPKAAQAQADPAP